MLSEQDKKRIRVITERFNEIHGAEFLLTKPGMKAYRSFLRWTSEKRCVLVSTLPNRRGLVALKVAIHRAVKVKPS